MAKKKKDAPKETNEYIWVEEVEAWLQAPISNDFSDMDFMRIVLFYVLHSPCKKGSYSPVVLDTYGWKNPWHSSKFRALFDSVASFTDTTFQTTEAQKDFKTLWEKTGIRNDFYNLSSGEFAVFSYVGESNPRLDLLHHIRNSFAHGRFTVKKHNKEFYIYLEDVKEVSGKLAVNARIMVKKSTLLKWIDLFECKTEEAKKLCHD